MHNSKLINLLLVLSLAGCSGGGSNNDDSLAGIGGTGAPAESGKATGSITGFGSIFVNGIEFDTSSSSIIIDGNVGSEADLKLGMVVNITGDFDTGSGTGTAMTVEFDDGIQGPVAAITANMDLTEKQLTILGVTISVEKGIVVFGGVSFDTLAVGDLLEISGFFDADGVLHATRVEKKSGIEVELKGTIDSVDSGAMTFVLGSNSVDYSSADVSALPGATPLVGQLVEVRGDLIGSVITATQVEPEDDFYGENEDSVSVEGLITELNVAGVNTFRISGRLVDVSTATFVPGNLQSALANNIKVKVQGPLVSGVIQATRTESRQTTLMLKAPVQSVAGEIITLSIANGQSVAIVVDQQTRFDDARSDSTLTLGGISAGDYLEVTLIDTGSDYLAAEVTRDEPDHEVIKGPVDSFVSGSSITLLGVTFSFDNDTEFEDRNDDELSSSEFFSRVSVGEMVKIEDERPGDGVADEVELE